MYVEKLTLVSLKLKPLWKVEFYTANCDISDTTNERHQQLLSSR